MVPYTNAAQMIACSGYYTVDARAVVVEWFAERSVGQEEEEGGGQGGGGGAGQQGGPD